jgi:hypothetical protein
MDRGITFYSVESFAGDDTGAFDGWPLPSLKAYAHNVRSRFPFFYGRTVCRRPATASSGS